MGGSTLGRLSWEMVAPLKSSKLLRVVLVGLSLLLLLISGYQYLYLHWSKERYLFLNYYFIAIMGIIYCESSMATGYGFWPSRYYKCCNIFFKAFGGLYFICFAMIRGVTHALGSKINVR